jgi:hypothetical protein
MGHDSPGRSFGRAGHGSEETEFVFMSGQHRWKGSKIPPNLKPEDPPTGDLVELLKTAAARKHALALQIRDALLAGDDAALRQLALQLVGLELQEDNQDG